MDRENMISRIVSIIIMVFLVCVGYSTHNNNFAISNDQIYAQTSELQDIEKQGPFKVTILKGAANPEVDITNLSPRQWYVPKQVSINQGNKVTLINIDN
jgi:hypothetical protein